MRKLFVLICWRRLLNWCSGWLAQAITDTYERKRTRAGHVRRSMQRYSKGISRMRGGGRGLAVDQRRQVGDHGIGFMWEGHDGAPPAGADAEVADGKKSEH
jgi:hypothetical protein